MPGKRKIQHGDSSKPRKLLPQSTRRGQKPTTNPTSSIVIAAKRKRTTSHDTIVHVPTTPANEPDEEPQRKLLKLPDKETTETRVADYDYVVIKESPKFSGDAKEDYELWESNLRVFLEQFN